MAINWLLALKAVPWTEVVQAAPHIVQGARRLLNSVRKQETAARADDAAGSGEPRGGVVPRLGEVEAALDALRSEQQASAALIRSLAEQNAKVIEAIEVVRARLRMMFVICAVLAVGLMVMAIVVVPR